MCFMAIPAAWAAATATTAGKVSLLMAGASAAFAGASAYRQTQAVNANAVSQYQAASFNAFSQAQAERFNANAAAANFSYQALMAMREGEASARQMEYSGRMAMIQGAVQARDMEGQAAQHAFQAAVSKNNATIAKWQQEDAHRRGEQAAHDVQRRFRLMHGSQRAQMAARGLDLSVGTPDYIQEDTRFFGQLDTNTVRHNAAKEVWEARLVQQSELAQSGMLKTAAANFREMGAFSLKLGNAQAGFYAQMAANERAMGALQSGVFRSAAQHQLALARSIQPQRIPKPSLSNPFAAGLTAFGTSVAVSAAGGAFNTFLGGAASNVGKGAVQHQVGQVSQIPFAFPRGAS